MRPPIDYKEQRILEMQRMKANCKADDLERLKTRCEVLTRNCVVGLLGQMADEEFYKMEGKRRPDEHRKRCATNLRR